MMGASPKKGVLHFELKSVWECFVGLCDTARGGPQNIATELKLRNSENPVLLMLANSNRTRVQQQQQRQEEEEEEACQPPL